MTMDSKSYLWYVFLGVGALVNLFDFGFSSTFARNIAFYNIPYLKSFVMSSVLGILITVILIQTTEFGVWSLIIGPGFAQLIYNNWVWPLTVRRLLNLNSFDFFITGLKGVKDIILFKSI